MNRAVDSAVVQPSRLGNGRSIWTVDALFKPHGGTRTVSITGSFVAAGDRAPQGFTHEGKLAAPLSVTD